jgi:hypothetical protein
MKYAGGSWDYLKVTPVEALTATAAGVAATLLTPVHVITTDGSAGLCKITLVDGTEEGQRHYFTLKVKGNASDTLAIEPDTPGSGSVCNWAVTQVGCAVELVWVTPKWQIIGGNAGPRWA